MDFSIIIENVDVYLKGLQNTLILVSISLLAGFLFAVPLAVIRTRANPVIQAPVRAFVYFFRGTPLLVQMFLVYYGLGQFEWMQKSILWPLFSEAYFCALLTFSLNTCAYTTEIIRGQSLPLRTGKLKRQKLPACRQC